VPLSPDRGQRSSTHCGKDGSAVPVAEEIVSPELVLVSPPELAAQAREALPDYELEFERWVVEIRAAFEAEAATPPHAERRFSAAAVAFTVAAAVTCAAPLILLILFRTL
jgi:hypothetical protein